MATRDRAPFWDHVQSSADVAVAKLGPCGRIVVGPNQKYLNVGLYSHRGSKFWYGDLDLPRDDSKLREIAKGLGVTVYIIPDMSVDDDRPIQQRALLEIEV